MTWFQPSSLEPLYKFEMLGLLASLAVYNGLTLPLNFPLAFYRKILGLAVDTVCHIRDGWPDLAKGFDELLGWTDGDVGDVFVRTYEFSWEAFGQTYNIDMTKSKPSKKRLSRKRKEKMTAFASEVGANNIEDVIAGIAEPFVALDQDTTTNPSSSAETFSEPPLVTNANRERYVEDYIRHLTHTTVQPQFGAFLRGFHTVVDPQALTVFTPHSLRTLVEGQADIPIPSLERVTRYDGGYHHRHPYIESFWAIARSFDEAQKRALLEFVTSCDRVPVMGVESLLFVVQRNGGDTERVPTSQTCFGRLLLPEYDNVDKLESKLLTALANGKGFGVP